VWGVTGVGLDGQSAKKEAGAREKRERRGLWQQRRARFGKESEAKKRRREREDEGGRRVGDRERGKRRGVVFGRVSVSGCDVSAWLEEREN
jgi:hypothetical protein